MPLPPGHGATTGTLLIDGHWQAGWKITATTLEITPFTRLTAREQEQIAAEGARLIEFTAPGARPEITFAPVADR